jgi:polysaccharide export outer membrane protein
LLLAVLLMSVVCAPAAPVTAMGDSDSAYILGPGDKLKITTYGEDRLTGDFSVNGVGLVTFPLVGDVRARGQTIEQFRSDLVRRLGDYVRHPSVMVEVTNFRPVFVLGEVMHPGQFSYSEGMTIYALVAQAGGFTYRADRKRVLVRHENEAGETRYSLTAGAKVSAGDTVRIPQRFF